MRVAYVTSYDAGNIASWSGTGYFIWKSLADRGINVELIGSLPMPASLQLVLHLKQVYHQKISRDLYLPHHDLAVAKSYARTVRQKLSSLGNIDAVVCPGTIPVAFLPGNIPLVTVSDATHRRLFNSYPGYEGLCLATVNDGDRIEQAAIRRAAASVYASNWAATSAVQDYQAVPDKVHVVPFGANLDRPPSRAEAIRAVEERPFDVLKLLFIGVEWKRKGGPAVMDVVRHLVARNCPVHLTIVGCEPEISPGEAPYVTLRGVIKKTPQGQQEICDLIKQSHFLIVPSEAECYGMVYCEAAAFGVPCIARRVGGVPTIVRDNVNGRLFDPVQPAEEIAGWIIQTFSDRDAYRQMAWSSREEYETRLNWSVAGEKLERIIAGAVENNRHQSTR
jgi:glycosyltransferase involved in cell wall biosynthesis